MSRLLPLLLLLLAACHRGPGAAESGPCDVENASHGLTICVHDIPDRPTWNIISGVANTDDVVRLASYMTPASEDAPLPTLFVNQNLFPLHYNMLTQIFTDEYAGLTWEEYGDLVTDGDNRTYWAGDISQRTDPDGSTWYSFVVWERPTEEATTPTLAQVVKVWLALRARFDIGDLVFVPYTENQEASATHWDQAPFEIRVLDDPDYEVYTTGTGYGTLRLLTLDELQASTATISYQDILILDEAPLDIERVVAGVVTGTRQGALSHINVRSAARGTPNCYVSDPFGSLRALQDQLVALTCGEDGLSVSPATPEQASAFWDSIRPDPVEISAPDLDWDQLIGLWDLPTVTASERALNLSRYGAKGSNLGTLYQRIMPRYQLDGFVVPFSWYADFMADNTWTVDLGDGPVEASFQATLETWLADEEFRSDGTVRQDRLDALRDAMKDGVIAPEHLDALADEIRTTWGRDDVMVRFRSSSNAEDALEFSGAGLYVSESGCLTDELDGDDDGPSACDPDKSKEQTLSRAMIKVWASLWTMEAFDERDWYSIDHGQVAMGLLANIRIKNEQANAVAFTGNPTALDDRTLIEAQIGEYDVVSSEPGITPETTLVTLEDGVVIKILRVDTSSERDPGDWVLSDAQVTELAHLLWHVEQVFPIDAEIPDGQTVLIDTEWKVDEDGNLLIKQVRPFLRNDAELAR